jgi:hypothetical protein
MKPLDSAVEEAILYLLAARGPGKTICPSEAARQVATARGTPHAWQSLMEPARAAARHLVAKGRIVITQHGRPVNPTAAHGPIRLKLRA